MVNLTAGLYTTLMFTAFLGGIVSIKTGLTTTTTIIIIKTIITIVNNNKATIKNKNKIKKEN
jgi:hypothetical protein